MNRIKVLSLAIVILAYSTLNICADVITPISGDPFDNGIAYRWTIQGMGVGDTSSVVSHVGALSFEDPVNFTDPDGYFGWTHTSNWVQLQLTEAGSLTIQVDRTANVPNGPVVAGDALYPAFVIWKGTHNVDGDSHVYNNSGNFNWAPELTYIGNDPNAAGANSVTRSFNLEAGDYSIVIGGHPPTGVAASGRQGYTASFSVTAVPEPSTIGILAVSSMASLLWKRRKSQRSKLESTLT